MDKKILKLKLEFCAAAVVFFVVLLTCGLSFGWFSQNRDVDAEGMAVSATAKTVGVYYRVQNSDGTWPSTWTFVDSAIINATDAISCPGDDQNIQIKVINTTLNDTVSVTNIGFRDFTIGVEETANSKGVYLGTQIYADIQYITNQDLTDYTDVEVITDSTSRQQLYNPTTGHSKLELYTKGDDDMTLEYNDFFIYTLNLYFIDSINSQDDYKNFGVDGDGTCYRSIYVFYE